MEEAEEVPAGVLFHLGHELLTIAMGKPTGPFYPMFYAEPVIKQWQHE